MLSHDTWIQKFKRSHKLFPVVLGGKIMLVFIKLLPPGCDFVRYVYMLFTNLHMRGWELGIVWYTIAILKYSMVYLTFAYKLEWNLI